MSLKMKELPESERPYEKLKLYGAETLSTAELLAIIIKTGTKEETALDLAMKVLLLVNSFYDITDLSIEELQKIKGIGPVKAIQIKACCEISKRLNRKDDTVLKRVASSYEAANLFMDQFKFEKKEKMIVLILNHKNRLMKVSQIAQGAGNCVNVKLKAILKEAIKVEAPNIILIHNHPSGDPTPSADDIKLTRALIVSAHQVGIKLLDHIVIGHGKYESILSREEFKNEIMGL